MYIVFYYRNRKTREEFQIFTTDLQYFAAFSEEIIKILGKTLVFII